MTLSITRFLGLLLVCLYSSIALGVDQPAITTKYSLVGVIANGTEAKKHKGIAVIRDTATKRSITISVGEFLPYSSWKVQTVERDRIIVSDGRSTQEVRYMLDEGTDALKPNTAKAAVEQGFGYVESEAAEPSVLPQKAWDDFYRDRKDQEEFDRRVTIVVGETPMENREPSAKEYDAKTSDYSHLVPHGDDSAPEAPLPDYQSEERVNTPDDADSANSDTPSRDAATSSYQPLIH